MNGDDVDVKLKCLATLRRLGAAAEAVTQARLLKQPIDGESRTIADFVDAVHEAGQVLAASDRIEWLAADVLAALRVVKEELSIYASVQGWNGDIAAALSRANETIKRVEQEEMNAPGMMLMALRMAEDRLASLDAAGRAGPEDVNALAAVRAALSAAKRERIITTT